MIHVGATGGLALLFLMSAAAAADPPPPVDEKARPWAEGVAPERQAEALQLFEEGNRSFEQGQAAQALAAYRRALEAWNHPSIQYNAAVVLIQLDQPLPAYESLREALRYGPDALEPQLFQQAQTYQKLLLGQLATLKVVCTEPGARVLLDGKEIFVAPGVETRVLRPGAHQIVANKPGYLTATQSPLLVAGRESLEVVRLAALPSLSRERRWRWWAPLIAVGAGVALSAVGLALALDARATSTSYDQTVAQLCPQGCAQSSLPSSVRDAIGRSEAENGVGIGLLAGGGAVLAGSVVMALLNQPHLVERKVVLLPSPSGLSLAGRF